MEDDFSLDDIKFDEIINYPISWWIKSLDEDLWWQPKWKYIMLYGWPSTWKTTLTLQVWIENTKIWNKVCYLSFEMPKKDFIVQNMRTRAWLKQVWVWESTTPTINQQQIMKAFVESIKWMDIKWYIKQPSLKEFKDIMESLSFEHYDEIIIDNLWMIWRWDNKDEMQLYWEISAFIKEYVDKTWTTVLILHHTNKWSEASNWKRWFNSFRWNWKIADDCDYVIQLQREFMDNGWTSTTIKVEKDRISGKNWYSLPLMFENWVFSWDVFR
jgi:KaiC/GvpD/RAD55 family RecA-like ATPase